MSDGNCLDSSAIFQKKKTDTYDHAGNKLTSTETVDGKESKTEFSYDAENRLLEMKSGDKTITYTYDKNGNRISSGAGDAKLDYIYDTENRLLAVKDKEGLLFAALYDGDDNRVFTASRTQATNTYQLFKRKPADKKRKSPYTAPDGEANSLFWYGFTQNVVQFFSSFTTSEGYDWIETFDTVSTAYHQKVAKDRATEEGLVVNPPSEDNLPGEDEVLYRSQVQDVLIPYTTKEDIYNYYETRNYVNDVNQQHTQVLQTYDDQLQKRETYVYGNGRATYTNESTGDSYHYLTSQSGSVTGLTQNGQAVASSSYALYGATKQTTDATGNPFAYNGEARDVTGLDYIRARYYDNQAGTFLTADSYSGSQTDPLSQNIYAYVQNNPANYTDPSGHIGRPNINLPDSRGSRKPKRSSQSKSNQSKVYPIFPSGTSIIDQQLIIANQSAAQGLVDAQKRFIQETKGYSYNPIVDMFRDPLGPSRSPIDYGSTPFATITRSYIDSVLTTARQTVYTPPPSDYERAVQSGQSTYDWSRSTTREAKNIHRNWTKTLEETIRHVCNTQTAKGKDSGTQNKPNISVADFRKIEEANKYGLTVAEKAKIDKMSMSDLKSQYSSVIGNYNTYIGTGYFNPLGIGENRAVIERYKILKAEEEAKAAAQAAELAKYHYLNLYKHIQETGLRPDGTPATDLEKKIAPYVPVIPIIQAGIGAYTTRQFVKYESSLNSHQVNSQKSQSFEKAYEPFLPDAKYSKKLPQNVSPGIKYLHKYDANGVIKQTKFYDDYGRQIGWVDYSDHGHPNNHSNPHWHQIIYNKDTPGTGYKIDYRFDKNVPFDFGGNH
ncbi:TPA: hypothetical protein U1181_000421 [Streptococcus suis]|nr:hypothetical protein [Streptococcus suis]